MKFIVDAQLPRSLSITICQQGYDSIHTLDLHQQNRTKDSDIIAISTAQQRVVITKDSDFLNSFLLKKEPSKLIIVRTGNITNSLAS